MQLPGKEKGVPWKAVKLPDWPAGSGNVICGGERGRARSIWPICLKKSQTGI